MEEEKSQELDLIIKEKNFKEFENWRNQEINDFNENIESIDFSHPKSIKKKIFFTNFPKCMVQMTKQMCDCDRDCLGESFMNLFFNTVGLNIDKENLYLSTQHVDCDIYGKRIYNGKMYNISELLLPIFKAREDIQKNIAFLCENEVKNMNNLQCNAYQLSDFCKDDFNCYTQTLQFSVPENCSNSEFFTQLDLFEDLIGFNIKDLQTRERKPRSVENDIYLSYSNTEGNFNPSTLASPLDQSSASDIFIPLISFGGMITISIFGFIIFKLFKRYKKKEKSEIQV